MGRLSSVAGARTVFIGRLRLAGAVAFILSVYAPHPAQGRGEGMPDDAVRRIIINDSIASYPSVCACPYSTIRNGRPCGSRSAYSRPGGRSPMCYAEQITREMIAQWRAGR